MKTSLKDIIIIVLIGAVYILWIRQSQSITKSYGNLVRVADTGIEIGQVVSDVKLPLSNQSSVFWDRANPLGIPQGKPKPLPSIRVEDSKISVDNQRSIYGGKGDKPHLGGFTEIDLHGISPSVWKYMITNLGVHSMVDVGCGRGISTAWFLLHGCEVLCVEGSHDAVQSTMLPDAEHNVVEHDFSRGAWWPERTYDAVWAVEFLEHVGVHYHFNYVTIFRKAAIIFVTSSRWGGWHHVEVHQDDWWIQKYQSYGLIYDAALTDIIRKMASSEGNQNNISPTGKPYNAQHVWLSMKVFINPMVASLPEHAHLFPEHGCYNDRTRSNRVCGARKGGELETPLPKEYWPLELTPEMDSEWENLVKKHIKVGLE